MPNKNQHIRRFLVAPMMDQTDRHCRFFMRLLSARAVLYTEMITAQAIVHGNREGLLGFDQREQPVALQLGGSDPGMMAEAARAGEEFGYREININVGCPSDRVQSGRFGACLMAEPNLVANCVERMRDLVNVPVTVKSRIGIDDQDGYEFLHRFVSRLIDSGCGTFIVHARKAWLRGLSPRQNREIPPLRYPLVHRLKQDFPATEIIMNGGLTTIDACREQLRYVDGVMLGREPYRNPYLLAGVDRDLFGEPEHAPSRQAVVAAMVDYAASWIAQGLPLHRITRHMLGLFQGQPGARSWRRYLSEHAPRPAATASVLLDALAAVHDAQARTALREPA